MPVVNETPVAVSVANGVTTSFPHNFTVLDDGDIVVTGELAGATTTYVLGADYSVTGTGTSSGSVEFTTAPANGTTVTRYRDTALIRDTDYQENGALLAQTLDNDFDRLWLAYQEVQYGSKTSVGSIRVPIGEMVNVLPNKAGRALKSLTFDADGNPIASAPAAGTADALAAALIDTGSPVSGPALVNASQNQSYTTGLGKRFVADLFVSDHPFNAVGDNTTDCTAAIQAALNLAGTQLQTIITNKVNLVTARVRLGRGRFKISAPLLIPEGVILEGESPAASIIVPTHTGIAIQMGGNTREYANVIVRNLGLVGNRSGTLSYGAWTTTTTIGIYAENCIRGCAIQNCFITQCQTSIKTENSYQFKIRDNYCIYALDYHVETDNLVAGEISCNRFDWSEKHGIYFNGTNSGDATITAVVERNSIQICWRNGIWAYDVSSIEIRSNFFEGNYREASSGATHVYADVNFESGPNNRGNSFVVHCNYFTHGSGPNFDSYTAIRCNRAQAITMIGNVCVDSFYWRMMDVDNANIGRIIALGNTFSNSNGKITYDSTNTSGLFEEQDGDGVITISELRAGGLRLLPISSGSNQSTNDKQVVYLIDCSAGNRSVDLKSADCVSGRTYIIKKTDSGANSLTVTTEGAETIDGAATATSTAARVVFRVISDGTNWHLV